MLTICTRNAHETCAIIQTFIFYLWFPKKVTSKSRGYYSQRMISEIRQYYKILCFEKILLWNQKSSAYRKIEGVLITRWTLAQCESAQPKCVPIVQVYKIAEIVQKTPWQISNSLPVKSGGAYQKKEGTQNVKMYFVSKMHMRIAVPLCSPTKFSSSLVKSPFSPANRWEEIGDGLCKTLFPVPYY